MYIVSIQNLLLNIVLLKFTVDNFRFNTTVYVYLEVFYSTTLCFWTYVYINSPYVLHVYFNKAIKIYASTSPCVTEFTSVYM